jgi:hypothetical protein
MFHYWALQLVGARRCSCSGQNSCIPFVSDMIPFGGASARHYAGKQYAIHQRSTAKYRIQSAVD